MKSVILSCAIAFYSTCAFAADEPKPANLDMGKEIHLTPGELNAFVNKASAEGISAVSMKRRRPRLPAM